MTISGGEPFVQAEFTEAILTLCRKEGIPRPSEQTWRGPGSGCTRAVGRSILVDIKMMGSETHQAWTGMSNARTLDNLQRSMRWASLWSFTPRDVGVNDRPADHGDRRFPGPAGACRTIRSVALSSPRCCQMGSTGLSGPGPNFIPTAALEILASEAQRLNFIVTVGVSPSANSNPSRNRGLIPMQARSVQDGIDYATAWNTCFFGERSPDSEKLQPPAI